MVRNPVRHDAALPGHGGYRLIEPVFENQIVEGWGGAVLERADITAPGISEYGADHTRRTQETPPNPLGTATRNHLRKSGSRRERFRTRQRRSMGYRRECAKRRADL